MSIHTPIFKQAAILPADGSCVCVECGGDTFNRSEMSFYNLNSLCSECLPLWTYSDRAPKCSCGHDVINHGGQRGFAECHECRNSPRVISFLDLIEATKPLPDADAFYDLAEPSERKYGLGGIYDAGMLREQDRRDHEANGVAL